MLVPGSRKRKGLMSVGLVPSLASFRSQVTNVWRDARAVSRALPINALPDVWPRPPTRTPQSPPTPTPTTTLCRVFSPATLSHEYACEHTFWVSMVTNFSMQSPLSVCLLSSQPADRSFFFLSCVRRIYISTLIYISLKRCLSPPGKPCHPPK